ncbi:hypothetical protein AaE_014760 [Aphanomyces astaci]|uniref:Prokaryotic-type class I peptide chain release factors domain-containing protein n=1 Tax=Aphanomyces astaci TaxID=112090 RepID=A0A6A4Z3X8_APHAT|nr:hypothetical protein AaE_014760 [Aphanomyces astaci]
MRLLPIFRRAVAVTGRHDVMLLKNSMTRRHFALHSSILDRMSLLTARYKVLSDELSSNDGNIPPSRLADLSIELAEMEPAIHAIQELTQRQDSISELDEVIADTQADDPDAKELREMATEEKFELLHGLDDLEKEITRLMLPKDKDDDKSAILEIRAGTGGDEAALFGADVFRMYQKYSLLQGWKFEILTMSDTSLGGCKECSVSITSHVKHHLGRGVYGRMKFESGTHRVQRVPVNDSRVHTSAITIAVLPEMNEVLSMLNFPKFAALSRPAAIVEMKTHFLPKDIRIDVYRASGAGGQHVNTTESAVRITHLPTGIVAANKAKAMKILCARVYDGERRAASKNRDDMRNSITGSGDRSERIRTYNFPQSRISDHRVEGLSSYGIERMLEGELLDDIIDALVLKDQNDKLQHMNSKLEKK